MCFVLFNFIYLYVLKKVIFWIDVKVMSYEEDYFCFVKFMFIFFFKFILIFEMAKWYMGDWFRCCW